MSPTSSPATILDLCVVLKPVLKTLWNKNVLPTSYCASLSVRRVECRLIEAMTAQIGEPPDHEVRKNQRHAGEQGLRVIEQNKKNGDRLSSETRNAPLESYGGAVVANGFAISIAGSKEDGGEELDEALAVLLMVALGQLTRKEALDLMAWVGNTRYSDFDSAFHDA